MVRRLFTSFIAVPLPTGPMNSTPRPIFSR